MGIEGLAMVTLQPGDPGIIPRVSHQIFDQIEQAEKDAVAIGAPTRVRACSRSARLNAYGSSTASAI
jgi:hypothetical protein